MKDDEDSPRFGFSSLLGTVAGEVLREVACDVLVVPPAAKR